MKRLLLLILIFFGSCVEKTESSNVATTTINLVDTFKKIDTTRNNTHPASISYKSVFPFVDTAYKLTLHIFNNKNFDEQTKNAILTFTKNDINESHILFSDSLYCMYDNIEFIDFNNDKVKDVLMFYYTGGRANPTYHLYISDTIHKKLTYVKGFEELPNPYLDSLNNIITSIALSGTNYYSFYRISTKNKLTNLRHSFEEEPNDSTQYENAIRLILSKH